MIDKRSFWKRCLYIGMGVLCLVLFLFYSKIFYAQTAKYRDERMVIGTYVRVDIYAPRSQRLYVDRAMRAVWKRFEEIEQRMNAYDSASEIGQVNAAHDEWVNVHKDVYRLIHQAVALSAKTDGAFDITVRPLIELWNEKERKGRLPTKKEVRWARNWVNVKRIKFSDRNEKTAIACRGCSLDLGGIAKGYAIDEAVRILRDNGFQNFLIDAGGDMYAAGGAWGGDYWRIGVCDPRRSTQLADIIMLSNQAVTTSGDYEQFVEINGKRFSHIIDPVTGYPQKGVISATVIAPTATEADAFSTALMVKKPEQGIAFIDSLGDDYAAMVITQDDSGKQVQHRSRVYGSRIKYGKALKSGYISK